MNGKIITIVAVSLAVIAAAVAAIVVSNRRADEAWAYESAAKADAKAQEDVLKAEKAKESAEKSRKAAAEADKAAKEAEREAKIQVAAAAASEEKSAAAAQATAEANAAAEKSKAEAARAARDEAKLKAEAARLEQLKAKELAAEAAAKAEQENARLATEKLKSEKTIAEAELRKKEYADLVQWSQDLADRERDVAEREQALRPEKTIADLSWAGGSEDTIIDEKGNVRKQVKTAYDPEKDLSLPEESRRLARAERLVRQAHSNRVATVRASVIGDLEKLYAAALKEGRVIDAEHYRANILTMYPDWKFKGEKQ